MSFVDLAYGGAQTIQQLLLQRELERMGVSPAQLAQAKLGFEQRSQNRADQEMQLRRDEYNQNQQRLQQAEQDAAQQKLSGEGEKLANNLPPGAFLRTQNPAVSTMQRSGYESLLQPSDQDSGLPAMGAGFTGPMNTSETPQEAQTGKYQGFLKQPARSNLILTRTTNGRPPRIWRKTPIDISRWIHSIAHVRPPRRRR